MGEFSQIPQGHLNTETPCQKCRTDAVWDNTLRAAREIHGDRYDYHRESFVSVVKPMRITCPIHGDYQMTPNNHVHGGAECKPCALAKRGMSQRKTREDFISDAKLIHGGKYDYSKVDYKTTHDKVVIVCPEHGDFEQDPSSHLSGKGCRLCGIISRAEKQQNSLEAYIARCKQKHGNKYDYSKVDYKGVGHKVTIICPAHGEFTQLAGNHSSFGHDCPLCAGNGISKPETELFEFVKSLVPDAEQSCRTLIAPQEIDIIVPSRKLAIEFNGLYWHSEQYRDKKYHIGKRKAVEAAGYRLISVREDLWRDRNEQVKSIIRNVLGLNAETVYARKCEIAEVSSEVAKHFMLENHVQGFRGATYHYALEHAGTAVAVMSVTHWKGKNEWEMVRYATTGNVVGGLSKLWKHVTRTHCVECAYSYVDRDLFTGSSYGNAGFTLTSSSVGFRIVNGSNTESREKWNKAPDGLTQTQWYEREGVQRIYDCGQDRLTWLK